MTHYIVKISRNTLNDFFKVIGHPAVSGKNEMLTLNDDSFFQCEISYYNGGHRYPHRQRDMAFKRKRDAEKVMAMVANGVREKLGKNSKIYIEAI